MNETIIWLILGLLSVTFLGIVVAVGLLIWHAGAQRSANRALLWIVRQMNGGFVPDVTGEEWTPASGGPGTLGPEWEEQLASDPEVAEECPVVSLTDEERETLERIIGPGWDKDVPGFIESAKYMAREER